MPSEDGIDLSKKVLADAAIRDTKLILLTGFDAPGLGMQALDMGFKAYLTKPVRQSQLLEAIQNVLDGVAAIGRSSADARLAMRELNGHRKELILVAEDYPINQQVAQLYLDELGFASHLASNGLEAVEAAAHNHYGVILMDCQMPEMDGFAATAAIRQAEKLRDKRTPIIAMTAHAMSGDRERCLAAGMDDFLSKPVDPDKLHATLIKWLGQNPQVQPVIPIVPIDIDVAIGRYGTSIEQICKLFLEKMPQDVEALAAAVDASDLENILKVAHGLKGACATMVAMPLYATCSDIERAVHVGDWAHCQSLIKRLRQEWFEARDYVLNYLKSQQQEQ